MSTDSLLADKFLPVDDGLYFIIPSKNLEITPDKMLVVKNEDHIFLKNGNTYAVLNDSNINHLHKTMQTNENITITFSCCLPDDYEIQNSFKVTLNKTECATLVGYYTAYRESLIGNEKKA